MVTLFLRTVIIYLIMLAAIRLMGKRQVGELEISELVITFLLSELAVIPISNRNVPLSHAIVPILLLLSAEVIISFILSKRSSARRIVIGKPSVLINKGRLDQGELDRLRMSPSELLAELRLKDVPSLSEVEYAIIEDNGQLSVIRKTSAKEACGMAHCIIDSGQINRDGLRGAGIDEEWLSDYLKESGTAVEDVCLLTVDDGGNAILINNEGNGKG
ncbi:MAG: DUF421 domain-containing protein [Clostridia bacterium]|nr:DUF421 domain-containing protein [Clostridia bacterium]